MPCKQNLHGHTAIKFVGRKPSVTTLLMPPPCADQQPQYVGVVRNPTQTAKQEQTPLSSMVTNLPGDRTGFTAEGSRLVVDEYWRAAQGEYLLHRSSVGISR